MLDWKITEAPNQDEARPEAAAPPHPTWRGLPRGAWILVSGVIGLVVVGAGLYSWWTQVNTHRAVQQALAQEASIIAAKDMDQIKTLYGMNDSDWDVAYTRWALAGQAAPRPLPFLYPLTTTGQITVLDPFAPNVLRAEVAHPFTNTHGQVLTFTTTYFYAFANDANVWQRIEPPANYWGEQRAYKRPYLTVFYWEPDQQLVDELGPFLDNLLNQLCAEWDCPADFKYELHLTDTLPDPLSLSKPPVEAQPTDPLFFDVLLSQRLYARQAVFHIPSPRVMGYPADAASRDLYRRSFGWQVLAQTSAHLGYRATDGLSPLLNPLYFGLLAEVGARLGLDSALAKAPLVITDLTELDWLGQWGNNGFSLSNSGARARLRPAHALMHNLLRDTSTDEQARLLTHLWEAEAGLDWVETGLGLTPEAAQARFDEAARDAFQIQSRVSGAFDWALSCAAGPAVLSLSDGEVRYVLAADPNSSSYGSSTTWAADGQHLFVSGYGLLVDLATGSIRWMTTPVVGYPDRYTLVNENVLAYLFWPAGERDGRQSYPTLQFQDLRDPQLALAPVENVWDYSLSPDHRWMALTRFTDLDALYVDPTLSLIPAEGGPPVWETHSAYPVWSADSRQLIYAKFDAANRLIAFYRLEIETGESHLVVDRSSLALSLESSYAQAVWSPTGEWLSIVTVGAATHNQIWFIRPDGSDATLTFINDGYIAPPRFSADGQFLAMTVYPPDGNNSQLQIMRVPTGEIVQTIRSPQNFDWSPTGHQLAIATASGLQLLTFPTAEPLRLNATVCHSVAWNPKP